MQSHEVMREVLRTVSAKQVASDMGLSLSLVYKWAEAPETDAGSGASNPLDRVSQLIRISGSDLPARWVSSQAGGFYIQNPATVDAKEHLIPATNDIVHEFADMLATIAQAAGDNVISGEEAAKIRRRWEDLKSVTEGFVQSAEKGNYRPKS